MQILEDTASDRTPTMNDNEFEHFIEKCYQELEQKQSYLTAEFKLGDYERFDVELNKGVIEFKENSVVKIICQITPIGSYSTTNSTWMWAWGNPSIPDVLKQKSERIKQLSSITGQEIFNTRIFEADEEMAWEIAAMACHHLKSIGCYRAPTGSLWVFLALDDVKSLD